MKRNALKVLENWKTSSSRKPLILQGARQTGKTWLMKEFGSQCYESAFYFNFDEEGNLSSIFENNKDPLRIIELLGLMRGMKIFPERHLIILDEVQECPAALNSLKYFCEKVREYHVVSAGSMLGTLLAQPKSYPVGKVNILNVRPLTFDEFLEATDKPLLDYCSTLKRGAVIESFFHNRLTEAYNYYLIIGGMPECVATWVNTKDPQKIRELQSELVCLYENDFSKHNGKVNSGRILLVFRSIVSQLAKANEKFVYGCAKEGARAREFETAIEWLVSAGMVIRANNVCKPEHPLVAFDQPNHFKLFLFDVGLLKNMAGISNEAILLKSDYQFKGALTENYILQQIRDSFDVGPRYFVTSSYGEIDFLVQCGMDIVPIEVKGGEQTRAVSFKNYLNRYSPNKAIQFSKNKYSICQGYTNIPLYLAYMAKELM
ncbi:MAG: AAA family ATPase [Holophagaceae bacterium]|nr:AAA family ATPase [Holophagaceae bacterium]